MRSLFLGLLGIILIICSVDGLNKQKDCKCRSPIQSRILNGKEVAISSYPSQLSLQIYHDFDLNELTYEQRKEIPNAFKRERHYCGAVLLNNLWAVTAAGCIIPEDSGISMRDHGFVGHGSRDLVKIFDNNMYAQIDQIYEHPNAYRVDGKRFVNDIALIKFRQPVRFTKYVQPACISDNETDIYDGLLKITGWGHTKDNAFFDSKGQEMFDEDVSRFLKVASAEDKSNKMATCDYERRYKKSIICVDSGNQSACRGDTGGPLSFFSSNKSQVIGIGSSISSIQFSDGTIKQCTGPATFTRLSAHMDFIRRHLKDDYCT